MTLPNINTSPPEPGTQQVSFQTRPVGVGMSVAHYEAMQTKIRKAVVANHTSSIWVALSIAALGVCIALWIAVGSTDMSRATCGKFEVAAWGFLILTIVFGVVHWTKWDESKTRADDLLDEIELNCSKVEVPPDAPKIDPPAATNPQTTGVRRGRPLVPWSTSALTFQDAQRLQASATTVTRLMERNRPALEALQKLQESQQPALEALRKLQEKQPPEDPEAAS